MKDHEKDLLIAFLALVCFALCMVAMTSLYQQGKGDYCIQLQERENGK